MSAIYYGEKYNLRIEQNIIYSRDKDKIKLRVWSMTE